MIETGRALSDAARFGWCSTLETDEANGLGPAAVGVLRIARRNVVAASLRTTT